MSPWLTESVGHYYTRAAIAALDIGEEITSDLADFATKRTTFHTPRSTPRTRTARRMPGTLKASIAKRPVKYIHGEYVSGVETDDPVAPNVEYGTGLFGKNRAKYEARGGYVIRPVRARALRFWVPQLHRSFSAENVSSVIAGKSGHQVLFKSGYVNTQQVIHPGSVGQHMFLRGIMDTETAFYRIANKRMKVWERELRRLDTTRVGKVYASVVRYRYRRGGSANRRRP